MKNLVLLKDYNSYFNRTIKINTSITINEFFLNHPELEYETIPNVNFNPNDFVNTEQIINFNENWCPDYVFIVNEETGDIESGWFITDSQRTRLGQFRIVLKRDVVNDYYEFISEAPTFIEKATIPPTDSAIFNSEGMFFNQIKTNEYLLKDSSNVAWIVGYVARDMTEDISINVVPNLDYETTMSNFILKDYINQTILAKPNEWDLRLGIEHIPGADTVDIIGVNLNQEVDKFNTYLGGKITSADTYYLAAAESSISSNDSLILNSFSQAINDNLYDLKLALTDESILEGYGVFDEQEILKYNEKLIYDFTDGIGKYYRVHITSVYPESQYLDININPSSSLGNVIKTVETEAAALVNEATAPTTTILARSAVNKFGSLRLKNISYNITLTEEPGTTSTATIHKSHRILTDAPYDMFCIPYGNINISGIRDGVLTNIGSSTEAISLNFAQQLAEKLVPSQGGTGYLYDLQLLPYFPLLEGSSNIITDGALNLSLLNENTDYSLLLNDNNVATSVLFWCGSSRGKIEIPFNYFVEDYKVENECDMWRLCSPNYQGIFEFSAAKNNGINYFKVMYTYKPYNPYIQVAPNWGGLYGKDFNDSRGLVLGGDFSLATTSDAFKQYEITNKNYQNIFDRGIKNMDVMRKYQSIEEHLGAVAGSFESSAAGFMVGGGWGAAIGGVAGLAAGAGDLAISSAKYKEQKSYKTDLYNYNLQNVKALPDSLTKSSSLTYNHKLFPFVEYYTCTPEEKEAFKNKIKYNGMTVMRIGKLKDFVNLGSLNFLQGEIIRLEGLCDDSHLSNDIYNEIKKGVYI